MSILHNMAVPPSRRRLASGETLFVKGDRITSLYAVESGRVDLMRYAGDGGSILLQSAESGDIIAEASLFAQTYHCNAQASQDSGLLVYAKTDILTALGIYPESALQLLAHFAHKLQRLRSHAALFGIKSAHRRVLAWLLLQPSDKGFISVERTWKQIAGELGLTHEAVYRALAKLERTGFVQRPGDGRIRLLV